MYLFFLVAMCVLVAIILVHKFLSYLIVDTILADWLTIPNLTYVQIQAKAYPQRSIHRGEVEENILSFKWKWNGDEMFSAQNVVNDAIFPFSVQPLQKIQVDIAVPCKFCIASSRYNVLFVSHKHHGFATV